jgi:hypothetical protein
MLGAIGPDVDRWYHQSDHQGHNPPPHKNTCPNYREFRIPEVYLYTNTMTLLPQIVTERNRPVVATVPKIPPKKERNKPPTVKRILYYGVLATITN